jgi:prolyl oligopeptidase
MAAEQLSTQHKAMRTVCHRHLGRIGIALVAGALCTLAATGSPDAAAQPAESQIRYPVTRVDPQVDLHFGIPVKDPYRWLEKDVRGNAEVQAWVDAQNRVTRTYLSQLKHRDGFKHRLEQLWDFEKFGLPQKAGGGYFFERNSGLQNQAVLYFQDAAGGEPRLLLDPNRWSADGTASLAQWVASPNGDKIAYAVQESGSDWQTLRVLDVATGEALPEQVQWVKYSRIVWARDGSGFYYSRFPVPPPGAEFQARTLDQAVFFHRVGSSQTDDRRIYATPDRPQLGHYAEATLDGRYLILSSWEGSGERHEILVQDLRDPEAPPRLILQGFESSWVFAGSDGDLLYFVTNLDAPRYRIVAVNLSDTRPAPRTVVAETAATLRWAQLIGGRFVAHYLEDAKSVVRTFDQNGKLERSVSLPGIGSVAGLLPQGNGTETLFTFASFNVPTTVYRLDSASGSVSEFKRPKTLFDPDHYTVRQVFYRSKDGTRVPMFISHRKGLDLSKGAPTLLYGYGGFNVPQTPGFSLSRFAWMDLGGVYVLANLRGGGEFGREWYDGGRLKNKQNVFDDFIAAAEYLIREGITTPRKLAIHGGSNGGLLVAAAVNQRPDLFAAALPLVGVFDMTRFDKFTAGRFWKDDFGDPSNEADLRNLLSYSPYHNIKSGTRYPAILVLTADTDDRVVPAHSFKYAAALQAARIGPNPHLIRIEKNVGHSAGKPISKAVEEVADMWAFAAHHTGLSEGP